MPRLCDLTMVAHRAPKIAQDFLDVHTGLVQHIVRYHLYKFSRFRDSPCRFAMNNFGPWPSLGTGSSHRTSDKDRNSPFFQLEFATCVHNPPTWVFRT